jgi:YD repeat-containing protein
MRPCAAFLAALGAWSAAMAQTASEETYEYDALGRLVKVARDGGGVAEYDYDPAGNRVEVSTTSGSAAGVVVVVPLNGFTVIPID